MEKNITLCHCPSKKDWVMLRVVYAKEPQNGDFSNMIGSLVSCTLSRGR